MRRILLIIVAVFIASTAIAKKVKVKDAELIARTFLLDKNARNLDLAYTLSTEGEPDIYVFNKSTYDGFVIVAADDAVGNMILGYSDRNGFSSQNIPDNVKWWLDEYKRQIEWVRSHGYKSSQTNTRKGAYAKNISPLLGNLAWDQGDPYNRLCPEINGVKCFVGCVATAMAQIMYYHKWPLNGQGRHSYMWNGQQLSVDFSKSVYDYSSMKPAYSSNTSEKSSEAVARLMYDCGVSVDMQYGINGSATYSSLVENALKTYFDYGSTVKYYVRDDYRGTAAQWDAMIMEELDESRPVYYSGAGDAGGHAFVCDGYRDNGDKVFFHFNFGWSGAYNAYFLTSAIDTDPGTFNSTQEIVIGIEANNKVRVGNLYFNLTGESTASLTSPKESSEYYGDIEIPSSVTIDGKEYIVDEIAPCAFMSTDITAVNIPNTIRHICSSSFYNCPQLEDIIMNRNNFDGFVVDNDLFDIDVLNNTTLHVPANSLNLYSETAPWWCFATIVDSNGKKVEYSTWKPFDTGSGICSYGSWIAVDTYGDIYIRDSKSDSNLQQMIFTGFAAGTNLLMNIDKKTGAYSVPKQSTNYVLSDLDDILYVSDWPTFSSQYTYDNYPITYNKDRGIFNVNLIYYDADYSLYTYGTETIRLTGYPDYTITITQKEFINNDDGSATQKVCFDWGDAFKTFKYAIFAEEVTNENQLKNCVDKMLDGSVQSKSLHEMLKGTEVKIKLPSSGVYTIIAIGLDKDGNCLESAYSVVYFIENKWENIGKARYSEDVITSVFEDLDVVTYDVDIMTNSHLPGIYRMIFPYGKIFPYNEDGDWDITKSWDITINAQDPDGVYIEQQPTGCNWGYGNMEIMSLGYYYMQYGGYAFDQLKEEGILGTLKDGIITFPVNGMVVVLSDGVYYGNTRGGFRLDLTTTTGINEIREAAGPQPDKAYNLQGQQVDGGYKGIVIQNGKKMLKK